MRKSVIPNANIRKKSPRPVANLAVMGKGVWPSVGKISRMDFLRGILNMEEFSRRKSQCLIEQTLITDKDGSLKATDEYGNISAARNSVKVGKTPYFLKNA